MRTSRVVLAGIAVAATAATTSAFTASNTVPGSVAGYGSATVSGVHVTDIKYTQDTDPTLLDSVEFTTTEDVSTGHQTATMVVKKGDGSAAAAATYGCDVTVAHKITCSTTGNKPLFADVATVGLTVSQ